MKLNIVFGANIVVSLLPVICPTVQAANVQVRMVNTSFVPNPVRINVGDTVTWVNEDPFQHTSTSGAPNAPDGKWNSPFMNENDTFPHTFDTAGTFPYFCVPHSFSMTGTVIVEAPQQGPTIAITSPANNAVLNAPGPITITAEGSAPGGSITMVEFFDGSTFLDMDHDAPFSITANLAAGSHSLTAKATSNNGATVTSTPVNVTVNAASAPTVTITAPANNSSFPGPTNLVISAEANANGGTITRVEFFNGPTSLGQGSTAPYSVTANLTAGAYTLIAVATTGSGTTVTSSLVNITIVGTGMKITNPYPAVEKGDTIIELQTVATGLVSPLGLTTPDDGSNRLFVFDQAGAIYVIINGVRLEAPLLDVSSRLVALNGDYDERGLLGLAVHPNFTQNPFIYTYTSEPNGPMADFMIMGESTNDHQSVIAEWKIDPSNPNRVDPASRREIMRVDQPQSNHNAGAMHFGHDGMLYIAFGDGGAADDQGPGHSTGGNGQDITRILGKLARIDIDARTSLNGQYGVPSDNAVATTNGVAEIYALGFRNPYSWSVDKLTGELYVADVGQNEIEEVNRVFKGGNYGWPIKEGTFHFDPAGDEDGFLTTEPVRNVPADLVDPIAEYDHSEGIAIVGGYVYRGTQLPGLLGRYIAGDLGRFDSGAGRLFYLDRSVFKELKIGNEGRALNGFLKGFGQDQEGELYVLVSTNVGPKGADGRVLKIVPRPNDLSVAIAKVENDVTFAWTGGAGPFLLQKKKSVDLGSWMTVASSALRTASVQADDTQGLLRVVDMAGNGPIPFTVHMTGAAERPPVTSDGIGTGTLSLAGNTLHFDIRYSGLSGPATLAHIHGRTNASASAGVMINLEPYNKGAFGTNGILSGAVTLTAEQKAAVLAGETYVNVHTGANPSGEIRGQIAPVLFTAELTGDAEVPPVETAGRGSGIFMLVGNQLTFDLEYHGLSTNAHLAHIHGPASETNSAPVMVDLEDLNGGMFGINGTLGGTKTLTPDQLAALIDRRTYVNIHTPLHGSGEIRGQLQPNTAATPLTASLSGLAERPTALTNDGVGTGSFALEGNKLSFNIRYSKLTGPATRAHIHGPASAAEPASVMIDLEPHNGPGFGTNGTLSGSVILTDEQRTSLLEGRTYVNVDTGTNPGGEIRGQILPVAMQAVLSGASERDRSVQTSGRGRSTLLLIGNDLSLNATYSGLSAPAIAAHIHGAAATEATASVMVNLADMNGGFFGTNGSFAGRVTLTPAQLAALADQLTYLNIHTGNNPGGEIRGQITR